MSNLNRNRFTIPPPNFGNENKLNPLTFQSPLARFNIWNTNLQSIQNMQQGFPIMQPKKNYCSTCDIWTAESYSSHQISAAHLTKKATKPLNMNFTPNYINSVNCLPNSSNNLNNSNISNNNNSNKRRYKRSNRKNRHKHQATVESDQSESTSIQENCESIILSEEKSEDANQLCGIDSKLSIIEPVSRGQEMLIPVEGVFCALCEVFLPDKDVAENDHCRTTSHCEAYEKLLKKVQDMKNDKKQIDKSPEYDDNVNIKRVKLSDDINGQSSISLSQMVTKIPSESMETEQKDELKKSEVIACDSEEMDRTGELLAPDFSLEFPDDVEDYDEVDSAMNQDRGSPSNEKHNIIESNDV